MGPLSSNAVIRQLNRDFVNTWVLWQDLRKLEKKMSMPEYQTKASATERFAMRILRRYTFPVDIMFFSAKRRFLLKQGVNDMLAKYQITQMNRAYLRLLQRAHRATSRPSSSPTKSVSH